MSLAGLLVFRETPLDDAFFARLSAELGRQGMSASPFSCFPSAARTRTAAYAEVRGTPHSPSALFSFLDAERADGGIVDYSTFHTPKKLIAFDMDSTLIQAEGVDEFAREMGAYDEVAAITESAMRGEIDFSESLRRRIARLQGLSLARIDDVYARIALSPGAEALCAEARKRGVRTAIISGGFDVLGERFRERLGIDRAFLNRLGLADGKLDGRVAEPIIDADGKRAALLEAMNERGIHAPEVIAVGDGANDVSMLGIAGVGVAFRGKPALERVAQIRLRHTGLDSLVALLDRV